MTYLLNELWEGNRAAMVLNSTPGCTCAHARHTHPGSHLCAHLCLCIHTTHSYQHEQYVDFSFRQLSKERYSRWDWVCCTTEQPPHQKAIIIESIMRCGPGWATVPRPAWWAVEEWSSSSAGSRHGWAAARQWSQENRWQLHSLLLAPFPGCREEAWAATVQRLPPPFPRPACTLSS